MNKRVIENILMSYDIVIMWDNWGMFTLQIVFKRVWKYNSRIEEISPLDI